MSLLSQQHSSTSARPSEPVPVRFGVVLFPGFQALDVFGPLDALNTLSLSYPLNLSILAATLDPVSTKVTAALNPLNSDFSQSINPTHKFSTAPPLDVLIVPGGFGARDDEIQSSIDFVAKVYPSLQYLITVCTGSGIAARAGILDGKRATTNKFSWARTIALRPQVHWVPHARWVVDGNIWTSSGVSAGLDVVFAFVDSVYGSEAADKLANFLEYERHMDPNWDPYAEMYNLTD